MLVKVQWDKGDFVANIPEGDGEFSWVERRKVGGRTFRLLCHAASPRLPAEVLDEEVEGAVEAVRQGEWRWKAFQVVGHVPLGPYMPELPLVPVGWEGYGRFAMAFGGLEKEPKEPRDLHRLEPGGRFAGSAPVWPSENILLARRTSKGWIYDIYEVISPLWPDHLLAQLVVRFEGNQPTYYAYSTVENVLPMYRKMVEWAQNVGGVK
jgi:hypothetical protein